MIVAAVNGGYNMPDSESHVPLSPLEIAEDAQSAVRRARRGVAFHARDDEVSPRAT